MTHYTERLRELKVPNHTLRDCFDPACSEFSDTTMDEKIQILQKVIAHGFLLEELTKDYCQYYEELNKSYVARDLQQGLKTLINHLLSKHTSFRIKLLDNYYDGELLKVLSILLKNTNSYPLEVKEIFYRQLVDKRKAHKYKDEEIFNPSSLDIEHDQHLNGWAYWHGDLNADILLIGQDFGDYAYYCAYDGLDDLKNGTNLNLTCLFRELGIRLGLSDDPNEEAKLYFTNAFLGVKRRGMAAPIKRSWYSGTAKKFIKPLIELVEPKVIIAMGAKAYEVMSIIYSLDIKPLRDLVCKFCSW